MASKYAKKWKKAMDIEMAALKDKGVLEMIPKCEMPIGSFERVLLRGVQCIKQYLESLEGYPCKVDNTIYVINKALYGLKQSGREWNSEVNGWFINFGFERCHTEPCLYYYRRDGEFAIVLLYVDDILCATENADFKTNMFQKLDKDYGLKDQGFFNTYLGVEVEQNENSIKIHQTK
ncbi:unnamed protein product [Peronospora destructor]|uniref:Reverse transcriptase Ty1/copia-type domain-containing protein n=1 Tax=Peronospora destructor TaxID=86335 RepID=A0AAV0TMM0_9STRA|nr:unnamed protein product [Peronospora destructor]